MGLSGPCGNREAFQLVSAERTVNAVIGGGCQAPIAAYAVKDGASETLSLRAMVSNLDASTVLRADVTGSVGQAAELGQQAAGILLDAGAKALLESVYAALEGEDGSVA